ncbi:MAG: outer membrane protein assembly factor BamB family protein [Planctomycetaceae bacterium]
MNRFAILTGTLVVIAFGRDALPADGWTQFRGPNASGLPTADRPLPDVLSPGENVVWRAELPPGHSSPIVSGGRVYVTAVRDDRLLTIALDTRDGKTIWETEAPYQKLEVIHNIGSFAQSSPATDGERVVSLFGSCGLFCYDINGRPLWSLPLGPFKNEFGVGSSPIIVDDRVILSQDHDVDSFLMAIDKRTGDILWKISRAEFPRNYCTPVIWESSGRKLIVVAATLKVMAYDLQSGAIVWTINGVARIVNMTPVVGDDGMLYVATWTSGADVEDRITPPPFDEVAGNLDANNNGTFELTEVSDPQFKSRFNQFDRDKDGRITRQEYEAMRRIFEEARNVVLAVRPGGEGDITDTHVVWRYNRQMPYVPSPLYYLGKLFLIKNGGILVVLDAKTGLPLKQGRVAATGDYYSSPVAGDGKVYLLSQRGGLTVLAADDGRELSSTDFQEDSYATPAIVDGRIYLRTKNHLYCFGLESGPGDR